MNKSTKRILLTGGTGFVGSELVNKLGILNQYQLRLALRNSTHSFPPSIETVKVSDLTDKTLWQQALLDVDVIIHLAARVHVMDDHTLNPLLEFRRINVEGTLNLAYQAAAAGVKRFIFISTIKVNGEKTAAGHPYTADDIPAPIDAYGISKLEAEQGLRVLASRTAMEIVIIRPVLVYGPGVKANFFNMMKWLYKGVPLPLGAIYNKRSLVSLDNLVDLIITCIDHPNATNQVFLISDGADLSTTELLYNMANALGKPIRLIPLPSIFINMAVTLLGKRALAQRLCGSLQVDINKTQQLLGWAPIATVAQSLEKTAQNFKERISK